MSNGFKFKVSCSRRFIPETEFKNNIRFELNLPKRMSYLMKGIKI